MHGGRNFNVGACTIISFQQIYSLYLLISGRAKVGSGVRLGLDKGRCLGSAHFGRMTRVVEVDVALDPADVGLLRAIGIVFEADGIPSPSSRQART